MHAVDDDGGGGGGASDAHERGDKGATHAANAERSEDDGWEDDDGWGDDGWEDAHATSPSKPK